MKRTLTLFAALVLLAVGAAAQKLSYSAVVRNSANELVANTNLTVAISIANSNGGNAVYSETHNVTTNQNGLVTLTIGDGTNQQGSMSAVTWATAVISSDYTLPGGAHVLNSAPVTAVPYALSAGNVEGGFEQVNADWNATSGAAQILNKPEIPVVNDGTLTIQKNGVPVGTFTANQAGNTTVNITITPQDILDAVNGMTSEQKSQLCQALNCGGEPGPSEPATFTCGTSTVEDHQHNVYHTVQIGTQCWTRENMRCTTSPKGNLTMGSEYSYDQPYYYNNTSTSTNYNIPLEDRGMYYNWAGAMDTVFASTDNRNVSFEGRRGICPEGWHVPSDAEWTTLTEYVSNNHACNGNSVYNAKALAINNEDYWNRGGVSESYPCKPEYDPATNNATGFSAVPSGNCNWNDGFLNAGNNAIFWSSSSYNVYNAYSRYLYYNYESVAWNASSKDNGFSVRCLKDATGGGTPTPPEPTPECPALGATTIENSNDKVLINTVITDYDAEKVSEENSGFRVSVTLPGATQSTEMEVTAASNSSSNNLTSVSIVTDNDGTMLHGEVNVVGAIQTYFPNYTSSQIAQILSLIQSVTITPFLSVACNGDTWPEEGEPVEYTLPTTEPSEPTTFTCGTSTVKDHQQNVYHTVQIGTQCWTRENMRCTTSPKGNLTMGSEYSYVQPYYYNNTSTSTNYNIPLEDRGMYYNWAGAMDTVFASTDNRNVSFEGRRGICPEGWHVPSDAEWTTLTEYVSNNHACNDNSVYNAKALAINNEDYWNRGAVSESYPCEPEYDPATNNATGFSAVPSGDWYAGFVDAGGDAYFWSSSSISGSLAYYRRLHYRYEYVGQSSLAKNIGFSVRCLKDATGGGGTAQAPTVTTGAADNITSTSATLNATVSNPDNVTVAAKGFEWKTTVGGTYAAVPVTGETMTCNLTGLTANTGYTFRAYITYDGNTVYGSEQTFTTLAGGTSFTCGTSTVEDHQQNVYHTVQIGTQCWTRENMRCTTSPKGHLTMGSGYSYDQPYYYNNTSTSTNYNIPLEDRGMYYNWAGAMDTVFASTDNRNVSFEGRRGICPEGWHVPSDAEWTTLTEYVSNNHACNGNSEYNAKALAIDNENYWNRGGVGVSESYPCDPEYDPATNNATGFSAVPSGYWYNGFYNAGNGAIFWSSSSDSGDSAYYWYLSYYDENVYRDNYYKCYGYSVRCLKDND